MAPENPYDPNFPMPPVPPLPPGPPPMPYVTGGGDGEGGAYLPPYSFGAAWERGFVVFKANYAALLGATAILFGAGVVDTVVRAVLEQIEPMLVLLWALPFTLCVSLPLNAGAMLVGARAARGGKAEIADIFLGYQRLGWVIIWSLLLGLACIGLMIPGVIAAVVAFAAGGETVGLLVTIPVALIYMGVFLCLSMRFFFVPAMLVDPELAPQDIFTTAKTSWKVTEGNWPSLLGLSIVVGLLAGATFFLLCLGILFLGYPIYLAIMGTAYAMVVNPLSMRSRVA